MQESEKTCGTWSCGPDNSKPSQWEATDHIEQCKTKNMFFSKYIQM